MVDVGQRHHRQQDEDHRTEAAAPGAQQTAHLRFVGGFRRAVVAHRSAPGHAVEKHSADADEDVEEIEVRVSVIIFELKSGSEKRGCFFISTECDTPHPCQLRYKN